jgi:hypothetical protein
MYKLKAKNRKTCRYDLISEFSDRNSFDYQIDQVDPEKYSETMILNENEELQRYVELRKPFQKTLTKHIR